MGRRKPGNGRTLFILLLMAAVVYCLWRFVWIPLQAPPVNDYGNPDVYLRVKEYYGNEVLLNAREMNLPPSYFMSLIILESSGRKIIPPRFEPHVYERLKEVKKGKRSSYEHVEPRHLADATDDALKNLASSWGPFQIMGYKCLLLGIKVRDIRGNDAVYWGMKWIDLTYGKQLRAGKYKDAFHIHNTGKKFPLIGKPSTHDPTYVFRGIRYMQTFETDSLYRYNP